MPCGSRRLPEITKYIGKTIDFEKIECYHSKRNWVSNMTEHLIQWDVVRFPWESDNNKIELDKAHDVPDMGKIGRIGAERHPKKYYQKEDVLCILKRGSSIF